MVQRSFAKSAIAAIMTLLLVCVYLPNLYRSIVSLRLPNEQIITPSDNVLLVTSKVSKKNATNVTMDRKKDGLVSSTLSEANATNITLEVERTKNGLVASTVPRANATNVTLEVERKKKTHRLVTNTVAKANATNITLETEQKKKRKRRKKGAYTNHTLPPTDGIHHGPLPQPNTSDDLNKTKIVGFINGGYSGIGRIWYNRLETLGYNNHFIICTDNETCDSFLHDDTPTKQYRTEASFVPAASPEFATRPYSEKQRRRITMMFAHRWVYLLEQLKLGYHILLTDVDNIFTSYYDMGSLEQSEFDVYHALETKHPTDVFDHQGFVFCGGMAWFRSSPPTIRYIEEMVRRCGTECDDQVLLNQILAYDLGVKWNRTEAEHMELTTHTEDTNVTLANLGNHWERLVGLVTKGFTGYSEVMGLKIKVWDRDFAYRGKSDPSVCPERNWVSMPFVTVGVRSAVVAAKKRTFDVWDEHCPNEYTNRTSNLSLTSPPSYEIYHGPLTKANRLDDLNKTKIVGFINGGYSGIGRIWYNRLETLGYDNHYIICTDNETCDSFLHDDTSTQQYRTEASFVPAAPPEFATRPYNEKQRRRVKMMFAHRWVYLLEQLKLGNHILLTDVDNIFTSYYDMSELERSEFDVFHALETKHPNDVFQHQGFVFCGGMAWFRSSPRTIRFIKEMVRRCGAECDDQVLLNQILAYDLGVKWNRTNADHSEVTTHTEDTNVTLVNLGNHWERLVGLVTGGFTGYSEATGLKIKVWDRDFAYRGKADPSICPVRNWVSMPFVTVGLRSAATAAKERTFDVWDKHCPNEYTNRTSDLARTSSPPNELYFGPLTQANSSDVLNKTKIVGFISGDYSEIGRIWYNRLETLGYDNHYIICTDNEACSAFLNGDNRTLQYRTETSFVPELPPQFAARPNNTKQRRRVKMMFAHRWVYLLEQLKLGYHILLTDVDNIFTSYYSMSELEQSEFDVFHALETKHPTDVFDHQGFVFVECDDQVILNRILAFDLGVKWNRTGAEHLELTTHTEDTNVTVANLGNHWERLVGLVTKGFTGYSETTGLKIKVWDRDFAYRGKANPSVCPERNWVSMPFVAVVHRAAAAAAKEMSFYLWDAHCPNEFTFRTRGVAHNNSSPLSGS
ncbi:nucleotide-diphospho-sugar transferase [Fragilaria crotonensis]|nr:nucleotide-diphospho-sugar transferase [Fragilaria crotonensis]